MNDPVFREADVVVVGTGAGGATVARTLARAGTRVLMVEEGPDRRGTPGEARTRDTMLGRFRDFGAQLSGGDGRIPLIQAKMVGGSTAINSAIFWRMPEPIYETWVKDDPRLGSLLPWSDVESASAEAEQSLSVREVDRRVFGNNNTLLELGAKTLGLDGRVIRRAEIGCEGTARCLEGCPNKRRQGMDVSYVPDALAHGAELVADTKVLRVRLERGRATGVVTTRGFIRARQAVVLSAGAIHTPWLLLRSGIRGAVGSRFTAHPGFSVAGMFDRKVDLSSGATQGYEVTSVRKHGLKIEALGMPKSIAAARLPGAGPAFKALSDRFDQLGVWVCLFRPERHGTLGLSLLGRPSAKLAIGAGDRARIRIGLEHLVKLFFAAGARTVFPGIAGFPSAIDSPAALDRLGEPFPSQLSMVATHLFGGAVLGTDPSNSVVDPASFQVHGVPGLHVADASLLPTSLGVNPQGTIMALSRIAAERIGAPARASKAA